MSRLAPYVHREGADVFLVIDARVDAGLTCVDVSWQHRRLASVGLAKAVAARVLSDLARLPERHGDILSVSVMYAEAALRFARLRARKEAVL